MTLQEGGLRVWAFGRAVREGVAGSRMGSRALILGGAISVLAAAALAAALPVDAPASAVRSATAPEYCKPFPAGTVVCDDLLETLTVTPGGGAQTTTTDFRPDQPYRFVFSGSVHYADSFTGENLNMDAFWCYPGTPYSPPAGGTLTDCSPPTYRAGNFGLFSTGGGLDLQAVAPAYDGGVHAYTLPSTVGLPPLSGRITFNVGQESDFTASGSYTIQIYTQGAAPKLILGLGDSLASGEGNPDTPKSGDTPARWLDHRCDRSTKSFEAQVVARLRKNNPSRQITFRYLACSGASIPEGLVGPYAGTHPRKPDLPAQVDEARKLIGEQKPDAVLVSAGVNDLEFGPVMNFCAKNFLVNRGNCMKTHYASGLPLSEWMDEQLRSLPGHYLALAAAFTNAGWPAKRIFITQYPNLFNDSSNHLCGRLLFTHFLRDWEITYREVFWLETKLIELNKAVAAAAAEYHWQLIKDPAAFNTHGYCAREPWIVTYDESGAKQGDRNGILHPNLEGQTAISNPVYAVVRRSLSLR